jgi:hypothetical protein
MCFDIKCGKQDYEVRYQDDETGELTEMNEPCTEHGQVIDYPGGAVVCADFDLVCTRHISPHIGGDPFGNPQGALSMKWSPARVADEDDIGRAAYTYTPIYILLVFIALW